MLFRFGYTTHFGISSIPSDHLQAYSKPSFAPRQKLCNTGPQERLFTNEISARNMVSGSERNKLSKVLCLRE